MMTDKKKGPNLGQCFSFKNKQLLINASGFTLIDVAILLVVISLLFFPLLKILDVKKQNDRTIALHGVPSDLADVLNEYALKNGEYPIPADPGLPLTNINVFKSIPSANVPSSANCSNPTSLGGKFSGAAAADGVLCRRQQQSVANPNFYVLIGALPVTSLGLPAEAGYDEFGHKFTYIVTKNLTSNGSMDVLSNNSNGAVVVVDQTGAVVVNNAHYAVVGHGQNGDGAYNNVGTILANNTCGASLDEYNRWACRSGATHRAGYVMDYRTIVPSTVPGPPVYKSTVSLTNNNNYYDDAVSYKTTMYGKIWTTRLANEEYFTLGNRVAVGFTDLDAPPTDSLTIMAGNIKIRGNLETTRVCDESNSSCFRADDIVEPAGGTPIIYCSTTAPLELVQQVSSGGAPSSAVPSCKPNVKSSSIPAQCAPGLILRVVGGALICS